MSTPVNTSSTDSQMHNNIMAAGSKDRPPNCLGLGKMIHKGISLFSTFKLVAATEGNPAIQQHTTIETVLNMTPENKEHFLSKKEAIFLLLTSIGDDIYSTINACKTANEMWIAIERLQQVWESKDNTVAGTRETGSQSVATNGDTCFNASDLATYAKECRSQKCADDRAALANLIANLTLDTEENKTILKQLKKANTSLTQELEECKTNLDETSRALGEATSFWDSCLIALQNKQNELEKIHIL
ncbi:hypothetical protein Tco_0958300 [Tanacetum coccineum]